MQISRNCWRRIPNRFKASAAIAALILTGCARQPGPKTSKRIAILLANVLIADPAAEWMRLAIPLVLVQDLSTAQDVVPVLTSDESGVFAAGATDALRLTIEDRGRGLEMTASESSTTTQRTINVQNVQSSATNLITTLDSLAHSISPQASRFGTRSPGALQAFAAAVFSNDAGNKIRGLQEAVAADPGFGLAQSFLIEALAATKSPELESSLAKANAAQASFTTADRARYAFLRSRVTNESLAKQASAGMALSSILPNDGEVMAATASSLFLLGKPDEGSRLMTRALALNPANAAWKQQFAVGLIENRQFAQAEKLLTGLDAEPKAQPILATCVFLEGYASRAASIYESYLKTVPNNDARTLLRASWQAHTGDLKSGIAALAGAQFQDPRLAAYAKTQMTIWYLLDKDAAGARTAGANAGPMAALLANGAKSASEWQSKVASLPDGIANGQVKELLLANGYFLFGFYPEAANLWKQADEASGNADLKARAMLAASWKAAGDTGKAQQVRVQPYVPDFSDLFSAISFRAMRQLLGQAG